MRTWRTSSDAETKNDGGRPPSFPCFVPVGGEVLSGNQLRPYAEPAERRAEPKPKSVRLALSMLALWPGEVFHAAESASASAFTAMFSAERVQPDGNWAAASGLCRKPALPWAFMSLIMVFDQLCATVSSPVL